MLMLSGSEISSIINFVDWNTCLFLSTNLRNKKENDQLFTTWPSPGNLDQISPFIVFFDAWEHTPCTRCSTGSFSYCWRKLAPVQNIKLLKPLMYTAHFIVGFGECLQPLDWVKSLIQIIPQWIDLFQSNEVSVWQFWASPCRLIQRVSILFSCCGHSNGKPQGC